MSRKPWYRALCFGKPVAPWRDSRDQVRRDLEARELGSFDEWGHFWITVPGDVETVWAVDQSKAA